MAERHDNANSEATPLLRPSVVQPGLQPASLSTCEEAKGPSEQTQFLRFAVDVDGFTVIESLPLHDTVDCLIDTVQKSHHRLYRKQRDLPPVIFGELQWPDLGCSLARDVQLSTYFSDPKYTSLKEIRLVAKEAVPGSDGQLPINEERTGTPISHSGSVRRRASDDTTSTVSNSSNDENRFSAHHQRLFYWICYLSLLWRYQREDRFTVRFSKGLGQSAFIALAVFYVVYVSYCPLLGKKQFAFKLGQPEVLTRIYFIVQGARYLLLYMLGMWLCYSSHLHDVIKKCSAYVVGDIEGSQWKRISRFMTTRAVFSVVLILLPTFTVFPALASLQNCKEDLENETRGLLNSTVPVEVGGYVLFCFISLPVFLTILFIVKVHVAEFRKFSSRILEWTGSKRDAIALFRSIQGAIRYSSDRLQWILAIYYLVMLLWMNVGGWLVVNKWIEFHDQIAQKKLNCHLPPLTARYTIILVTQLVWFYAYPLYYFSKLPRIMKELVVDISTVDYDRQARKGYLIKTAKTQQHMMTMVCTGLQHEPRFMVFWCFPVNVFSTAVLICVTPVLPIVWKVITDATTTT